MTGPFEPPPDDSPDDSPIDPNPSYPVPPAGQYFPPPGPPPYGPPASPRYGAPASPRYGPPGPPPPGYPGSYPAPWDTGRPGGIPAAAVLAYIDAGLLILAGLLLLVGASAVDSWNDAFGSHDNSVTVELAADGLVNLISAGLQIAGGVLLTGRSETGRTLLTAGGAVCIAAGVYWVIRAHDLGVVVWTIVFVALPIIALSLAWTVPATRWLRGEDPRRAPPRP